MIGLEKVEMPVIQQLFVIQNGLKNLKVPFLFIYSIEGNLSQWLWIVNLSINKIPLHF